MATEDSYVLTVADIVRETADAVSVVFEVPAQESETFAFKPGQFLTLGVPSDRTGLVARAYSICRPPGDGLAVTVKRTAEGYASNWINDNLEAGDTLRVLPPSGIFTPKSLDVDLLLLAGGSGVTPIMSIARHALEHGTRKVTVFYANRDENSVIFAAALRELSAEYAERLHVIHWLESVQGLPSDAQMKTFLAQYDGWTSFCCGPAPFMKMVQTALKELDVPRERRHQEKFISLGGNPFGDVEEVLAAQATLAEADDAEHADGAVEEGEPAVAGPIAVEVELDGQEYSFVDWDGRQHLLEFLESKGVEAPFSCREGECSACACMVIEGDLSMSNNDVLEKEDLEDGIRLSCQAQALTEKVRITYNG